ncbi:hypothetical protein [Paenibacillus sp. 1P07SE]|uniref:hypothetical protein n=1 Tax=Paenibacillus sp. 1P07SE TaxID=3132209 RepID=UPI0039A7769D
MHGDPLLSSNFCLGTEKSDQITLLSVGFGFGMFFLVSTLLMFTIGSNAAGYDRIFSVVFVAVSLLAYLISYAVSVLIYNKKEL